MKNPPEFEKLLKEGDKLRDRRLDLLGRQYLHALKVIERAIETEDTELGCEAIKRSISHLNDLIFLEKPIRDNAKKIRASQFVYVGALNKIKTAHETGNEELEKEARAVAKEALLHITAIVRPNNMQVKGLT